MAKKLSLMQFEEFNEKGSPEQYVFMLENQERNDLDSNVEILLTFDELEVCCNAAEKSIALFKKDRSSCFVFNNVKNVVVDDCDVIDDKLIWAAYRITCGSFWDDEHNKTYMVIAKDKFTPLL